MLACKSSTANERNILTAEDPIELISMVLAKHKWTLRLIWPCAVYVPFFVKILDVVMIGEIRDLKPLEIAVQAFFWQVTCCVDSPYQYRDRCDYASPWYGYWTFRFPLHCSVFWRSAWFEPCVASVKNHEADKEQKSLGKKRHHHASGCDHCSHKGYWG